MAKREVICSICKEEAQPAKRVKCFSCGIHVHMCAHHVPTFVGCSEDCRNEHKKTMKTAFGNKELIDRDRGHDENKKP